MPHRLHEVYVKSLVIILEIYPSSKSVYYMLPFRWISHNYWTALIIVFLYSHFSHLSFISNVQSFINFIFNRKTMTVPSKTTRNKMTSLRCISTHNILYGPCTNMTIVRSSSCKWRAIIKCKRRKIFGDLKLLLEALVILPILEYFFFFCREVYSFRNYVRGDLLALN